MFLEVWGLGELVIKQEGGWKPYCENQTHLFSTPGYDRVDIIFTFCIFLKKEA